MGRRKVTDGITAKQIRGPGRKSKKQGEPTFPKELLQTDPNEKKTLSSRSKKRARKRLQKEQLKQTVKQNTKLKTPIKRQSDGESNEDEDEEQQQQQSNGFTDENQQWLKPKKKKVLFDDDDDQNENESMEEDVPYNDEFEQMESSTDEDEEEEEADEPKLDIEKKSKKLREKQREAKERSDQELLTNIEQHEKVQFPSGQEVTKDAPQADLQLLMHRIREVINVLNDFKNKREINRTRKDYLDLLKQDLCNYYSYNDFLMEKLIDLFPLAEIIDFLEANEVQRPVTIRTNTLKTRRRDLAQALINRGVNVDPLDKWTKVGLVIYNSQVPIGATPEYLSGHYMLQGASSFLPVMALAPQPNERILDMCAAPGGKATYIGALMRNSGILVANDANKDRARAIIANTHRLGLTNTIVTNLDGRHFSEHMGSFDRCLVDAPCSGTGVIAKDPAVKSSKDEKDIQRCFTAQRQLLLNAIDSVNEYSTTGGYIVYSTCSILVEENEAVVQYALNNRPVKLVETGLEFGVEGFTNFKGTPFHPLMKYCRRYYPHLHNLDGFFVAKLKKYSIKQGDKKNQSKTEEVNSTDN
jgi:ribosomal RNA methyltransferase Nop2